MRDEFMQEFEEWLVEYLPEGLKWERDDDGYKIWKGGKIGVEEILSDPLISESSAVDILKMSVSDAVEYITERTKRAAEKAPLVRLLMDAHHLLKGHDDDILLSKWLKEYDKVMK